MWAPTLGRMARACLPVGPMRVVGAAHTASSQGLVIRPLGHAVRPRHRTIRSLPVPLLSSPGQLEHSRGGGGMVDPGAAAGAMDSTTANPTTRRGAGALTAAALAATAFGAAGACAHAEDGESTPPWAHRPRPALSWSALVRELTAAQTRLARASGFSAHRRRHVRISPDAIPGIDDDGIEIDRKSEHEVIDHASRRGDVNPADAPNELWEFKLEFTAADSADLFDVFSSLMNAFSQTGPAEVSSEELATRTTLRAVRQNDFALTVSAPRFGQLGTRIELEILRPDADARFSANQVAAVLRAYEISQMYDTSSTDGSRREAHKPSSRSSTSLFPGELQSEFSRPSGRSSNIALDEQDPVGVAKRKLEELGAEVFVPKEPFAWSALAGYDNVKNIIEESVVLPVRHPDIYEGIVRGTRERYESCLPRAILFTGPPGCGKTTVAKILSSEIGIPFVNLRLESLLSKYYGETTKKLSEILETTKELGPCLVFCDEIDSLGFSRDAETHEVTRRTLSVLLRHLDGLEGPPESILVAATNMPGLLDPALISRFDVVISFELPDLTTRAAILGRYAKQLNDDEKRSLAKFAEGFSGRELRDACEAAERAHAGRVVRVTAAASAASCADCTDERQVDRFCDEFDHDVAHVQQLPSYDDYVAAISRKGLTSISHLHRDKQIPAANHQSALAA